MADDDLKLGLVLGYWFAQPPVGVPEMLRAAEDLGFTAAIAPEQGLPAFASAPLRASVSPAR